MSMRISTATFQNDAVSQMDALEAALQQTQTQLSTGSQIQNAADNPIGAVGRSSQTCDRKAARVRRKDGALGTLAIELSHDGDLDVQTLGDRLDHDVCVVERTGVNHEIDT